MDIDTGPGPAIRMAQPDAAARVDTGRSAGPQLVMYRPGTVVSLSIPFSRNGDHCVEIKFNSMVKSLAATTIVVDQRSGDSLRSDAASSSSSAGGSASVAGTASDKLIGRMGGPKPRRNFYDGIIEKLERKYTGSGLTSNYNGNDDNENSGHAEEPATAAENLTAVTHKKKRKYKAADRDSYDFSDSFIDDTEAIEQLNMDMISKQLETKYGGFFVSSGELEVVKVPRSRQSGGGVSTSNKTQSSSSAQTASKAVASAATQITSNGNAQNPIAPVVEPNPRTNKGGLKLKPVTSEPSLDNMAVTPTSSVNTPVVAATVDIDLEEAPEAEGSSKKVDRVKKQLPVWNPSSEVTQALNDFKGAVSKLFSEMTANDVKLFQKQAMLPIDAEENLCTVHEVATRDLGNKLYKTVGYLESVSAIIKEITNIDFNTIKMKKIIQRVSDEKQADAKTEEIGTLIAQLKTEIIHRVFVVQNPQVTTVAGGPVPAASDADILSAAPDASAGGDSGGSLLDASSDSVDVSLLGPKSQKSATEKLECRWTPALRNLVLEITDKVEVRFTLNRCVGAEVALKGLGTFGEFMAEQTYKCRETSPPNHQSS
jgi:hypothetical protein